MQYRIVQKSDHTHIIQSRKWWFMPWKYCPNSYSSRDGCLSSILTMVDHEKRVKRLKRMYPSISVSWDDILNLIKNKKDD